MQKDTTPPESVLPSPELARFIVKREPVWRMGPLAAPKLLPVTAAASYQERRNAWSVYFRPKALVALETDEILAYRQLDPHDLSQVRSMFIAMERDIAGATLDAIVERFPGAKGLTDDRAARRAVKKGRELWSRVPAWPWALFDDGKPPANWRTEPVVGGMRWVFQEWAKDSEPVSRWLYGGPYGRKVAA